MARAEVHGAPEDPRAESLRLVSTEAGPMTARARRPRVVAGALFLAGDAVALAGALWLTRPPQRASWLYAVAALLMLAASHAYRLRVSLSALDDAPRLAGALAAGVVVIAPIAGDHHRLVLWQALLSVVLVVVARSGTYAAVRHARRHGLRERTLVAGTGHVGIELANLVERHPEYGLDLVGFVGAPFPETPAPRFGAIEELDAVVRRERIRRVLVAFGPTREAELVGVLRTAVLRDVDVHVVPRFFEVGVAPRGPDVDDLWGIPLYRVRQAALRGRAWRFKRAVDIVIASVALVLTAPVTAVAAVLVRLDSPGPILFRQRRIGQHGGEIEVLKFRTLPVDHVDNQWNADDSDYRSPTGKWLRRTSIDELPQLWNVLRGDMSLVGPRPERGYLVEQFNHRVYGYRDRHRLPVGLTGWAQVHGLRGETSLRERVRFDNQYIEHWSLWRDLVILVRTAGVFFRKPHEASSPEPIPSYASQDPLVAPVEPDLPPTAPAGTGSHGGGRSESTA